MQLPDGETGVVYSEAADVVALGSVERLAIQLQIPATAEGGRLARRRPAPSGYP
jgi:hypothetical protein